MLMKVCFITTGDIETLSTMKRATGMAEPLVGAGHTVAITALDSPGNRARFLMECPRAEILWFKRGSAFSEIRQKWRMLRTWKPDVVYVCAFGARNFIAKPMLPAKARIVIEHSELPSVIHTVFHRRLRELGIEYASVLLADGLLCASRYLEKEFRRRARRCGRKLPIANFPYAYNPVTLRPDTAKTERFRALAEGRKCAVYMGTLAINYGILDMIEAVQRLAAKRQDFVFQVLGRGRHEVRAHDAVAQAGLGAVVKFQGYVPESDVASWFAAADVFLAPIYDTIQDRARCPSKVYMYLPFAKPVVSSRIGDPYALLGEDGVYFAPGDVDGMAQALDCALNLPESWRPQYIDPSQHTWAYRTGQFLGWLQSTRWFEVE